MLSSRATTVRLLGMGAVLVALLLGTWRGQDDHFPFGPFRMYSTKQELDGAVRAIEIHGSVNGRWERIPFNEFGLRRADIEGQLGKLEEPPEAVLAAMYEGHDRLNEGPVPYQTLQVRERTFDLVGGRVAREFVVVLGTWQAP